MFDKIRNFLRPATPQELDELAKRLGPLDDVRDMVVVPGKPEDWLFHRILTKAKQFLKRRSSNN